MIKRFLNYVEIRTKITSLFTFLMTIAFLLYRREAIDWRLTGIFFAGMFLFDLATTAINNYIDTKTNHQTLQFKRSIALIIILILLGMSTILGLYLAYLTDIVILLLGGLCFLCGIFYTYGPVPISRQPLGEILSGVFYGLLIPFILMYINMPEGALLSVNLSFETISISLNVVPIVTVILFSIIPTCVTANIMLANNICDLEKDIQVKRHTLPYYLGRRALDLFAGLYYLTYIAIIVMVILRILSPICLIALLTFFIVKKNINEFLSVQDKETTFILAIKNYIIIMGTNTLMIFISLLFS
ncbi:UbiA family prenyltransferase [Cellulosilyticum sp. I15G10I2]|uniref:UbiA family prenyltransferase n=1 Tax=Cellulosilyticum sp. I15G10I2 TaxID=1892843 RepID=UPI00085CA8BD|nr:UbiA family prenyltransferase [Cellulosilyticum sp. I15G10I2]